MIDVKIFNVTVLMTNCCLLTDRKTGKMAVTDPGAPNEELNSEIEKNGGISQQSYTQSYRKAQTFTQTVLSRYSA